MNGSTENRAHGASEKPERKGRVFDLGTTNNMLPLVQRIVLDIVENRRRLEELVPKLAQLDRHRRDLGWPERSRRYAMQEEASVTERNLQEAVDELENLGLLLFDAEVGRIGFPTQVNSRQAFFSWQNGEKVIGFWHFPEDSNRRAIPATWLKSAKVNSTSK